MSWYKKYIEAEKIQPKGGEFSWVKIELPKKIIDRHSDFIKEFIDEDDLYIEKSHDGKSWSYGSEDDPHITVKFGFNFDEPDRVIKVLKGEKGGRVKIEEADIFDNNGEYDVLILRCTSKVLGKLHNKLTNDLKTKDTYPNYNPHITIGYFKKGMANKYRDKVSRHFLSYIKDAEFDFNEVIFEDRQDKETVIKLK